MLPAPEDGCGHTPWPQSTCQLLPAVGSSLLQGDSLSVDGCCVCSSCCAKEFLIPEEIPIVLAMIRIQNRTDKKLPIFFFIILSIFVVVELNIPVYDVYSLYASGIIQFNETLGIR